ncbi:MAG: 2-dehydropantoate 2-reductase [Pigmentiphaga sp.]|uniref:ketopantoate reductase family protein n=1 Tax=Pigmentiphaga sp. TaxID=1977564 RepID=UPI0029A5C59C|nr:2-dehydropantoate 2-reductase [Pigmentiphaga sp.]MDX3905538.1 2-dehydropantoate 2-reductase [Pigmentiphaga sp.]
MNIAVMGAGAVGSYYGGMLAKAGHEVVLIGRPAHVAAVREHGLLLDMQSFNGRVPVNASEEAEAVDKADLVLFCVKSTDTEEAGRQIAPYLRPDAVVLSLQNGVDNAERLQALLPVPVIPAVVYVAVEMAGAGHVRHHGRGELVLGPSTRSGAVTAALRAAGIPAEVSDNAIGELWAKLILNCAYNALSAIAQVPYGRLVAGPGVLDVMRDIVQECHLVADRLGVRVPGDTWEAVQRISRTMPTQFSSTAQDLARGKPSEIDHLNGYIVRAGERLGLATPVNRALHSLVRLLEAESRLQGR